MKTVLPSDLLQLQVRFEQWRKTRQTRSPIPHELLRAASTLLDRYSVSMVCRVCRLHPSAFKKLDAPEAPLAKQKTRATAKSEAAFYPLPPLITFPQTSTPAAGAATDCRLILERPDGARLTIVLPGLDPNSLSILCATFLRPSFS